MSRTVHTIKAFDGTDIRHVTLYDSPSDVANAGQYLMAVQTPDGKTLYGAVDKGDASPTVLKCLADDGKVHTIHQSVSEGPIKRLFVESSSDPSGHYTFDGVHFPRGIQIIGKSGSRFGTYDIVGGKDVNFTLYAEPKTGEGEQVLLYTGYVYGGGGGYTGCSASRGNSSSLCIPDDPGNPALCSRYTCNEKGCSCSTPSASGGYGAQATWKLDFSQWADLVPDPQNHYFKIQWAFQQAHNGSASYCSSSDCSCHCFYTSGTCGCSNGCSCDKSCTCRAGTVGSSYYGIHGGTDQTDWSQVGVSPDYPQYDQSIAWLEVSSY